jgi:Fic family protein
MPEYKWHPIEDISEDLYAYSDQDLRALGSEWKEVREKTPEDTLQKILEEVKREWAIETGKIEGLYTLTKGMTETLIKHGISAKLISHSSTNREPELVAAMLQDQQDVIEGLFDFVAKRRRLSLSYIREMHQTFTRHQDTTLAKTLNGNFTNIPLIKGDWKKQPNNPTQPDESIHEYCPPEHVSSEMDRLIKMHRLHIEREVRPEVEAAFLHHRFTQIHPFQDGSGRVARALASLIFLREGDFPFVVKDEERPEYIYALEEADQRSLITLIEFMSEKQKEIIYISLKRSKDINLDSGLHSVEVNISNFISDFELRKQKVENADRTIKTWRETTRKISKLFGDRIREKGITEESLIKNITVGTKQVSTNKSSLGAIEHIIGKIHTFDIFFQFPFQKKRILLRLVPSSLTDEEIILQAILQYQNGDEISSMRVSSNIDYRRADIQFQEWFQKEFGQIVEDWINI